MVIALSRRYSHPPHHWLATASVFPAFHVPIFLSLDEVYNLVKPVTVKSHVLFENVVVDIVLDDFPVYLYCALCCRFRSFPFRRRSRFPQGEGLGERIGMEWVLDKSVFDFSFFGKLVLCISLFNCVGFSDVGLSVVGFSNIGLSAVGFSNTGQSNSGGCGCS